jgi:hypothetical protein
MKFRPSANGCSFLTPPIIADNPIFGSFAGDECGGKLAGVAGVKHSHGLALFSP